LKSAVTQAHRYEPLLNRTYEEMGFGDVIQTATSPRLVIVGRAGHARRVMLGSV
jgi:hypothetical protein